VSKYSYENVKIVDDIEYGTCNRLDEFGNIEFTTGYVRLTDAWIPEAIKFSEPFTKNFDYSSKIAKLINNDGNAISNEFGEVGLEYLVNIELMNVLCRMMFEFEVLDKRHFKDVIRRYLFGEELSKILSDPKYVPVKNSDIDTTIINIIEANSEKLDGSDKVNNWLVGQVMKEARGKANPAYVKEKIEKLINDRN